MIYELWSTETDRLLGMIEVAYADEEVGATVVVRSKERIETCDGMSYNAVEVRVCRMTMNDKKYWALETNLPLIFVMKLEGFVPKLERPSLAQMHYINKAHAANDG